MNAPAKKLPERYQVLPYTIPLRIPGFQRFSRPDNMTFAPADIACEAWYDAFVTRVMAAIGKQYLPVCRLSDGEFIALLGHRPFDLLTPRWQQIRPILAWIYRRVFRKPRFETSVNGVLRYTSGTYTHREIREIRRMYEESLPCLAAKGILAMHLNYEQAPFQEHFFPALKHWLARKALPITLQNYVPFYFVYALLTGPRRQELLRDRRVLLVNGADADKQTRIEASLRKEGVREIHWSPISISRAFFSVVETTPWKGKVDFVLVGAGVGKPGLLLQLEPLGVPVIDAGYVFEVWADPEMAKHRTMGWPDDGTAR